MDLVNKNQLKSGVSRVFEILFFEFSDYRYEMTAFSGLYGVSRRRFYQWLSKLTDITKKFTLIDLVDNVLQTLIFPHRKYITTRSSYLGTLLKVLLKPPFYYVIRYRFHYESVSRISR